MHSARRIFFSLPALCCLLGAVASAQDKTAADPPAFSFGYQQRIRIETTDNAIGLSAAAGKGSGYLRNRTSVSARITPVEDISIDARLTNEFRYYFVPENREFDFNEIVFDQLCLKWSKPARLPLTLTLGRQNMQLGEGFVVMDGEPLVGSRSVYFNAARADWSFTPSKRLTLAYAYQPERDKFLPVLDDRKTPLVEQPEEAFIAYYTTDFFSGSAHAYFIRKNMYALEGRPLSAHINCPGVRLEYPLFDGLKLTGEAAGQFGSWTNNSMTAYGGYCYGRYEVGGEKFVPRWVTVGAIHLSGDDRSSSKHEGWDPLFSRWPKWSESYIYALIPEQSPAYWSNLTSIYANVLFAVTPHISFSFDYHHLLAPRPADPSSGFPGGDGKTRGDLFIGRLVYKPAGILTGQLVFEGFKPGDFYFDGADSYGWMLMEVMVTL